MKLPAAQETNIAAAMPMTIFNILPTLYIVLLFSFPCNDKISYMGKVIDRFISLTHLFLWIWLLSVSIFVWWIYTVVPDQELFGLTKILMKINIIVGMNSYIFAIVSTILCIVKEKFGK